MKTRIYLIIALMAGLGLSLRAEKFHARAIFDLRGDVREVAVKTDNPFAFYKKVSFTSDGCLSYKPMAYGEDGFPIGFGVPVSGKLDNTLLFFDEDGRLVSVLNQKVSEKTTQNITLTNVYDGTRLVERKTSCQEDCGIPTYKLIYDGEKYDAQGNWIERNVHQTTLLPDGSAKETVYVETRKITYY